MHGSCIIIAECAVHLHALCARFRPILIQINFREIPPWVRFRTTRRPPPSAPTIRWAPTVSSSSNTPIPKPEELHALFKLMGYAPVARHKTKKITVYRQGDINYLVNEEPGTHGFGFVAAHGPCAPSMAFRVVDAKQAYERALVARRGAGRCFVRAEDARCSRHQGHRRQPALFRRSLRRQGLGL